jgi:hypothetical protein
MVGHLQFERRADLTGTHAPGSGSSSDQNPPVITGHYQFAVRRLKWTGRDRERMLRLHNSGGLPALVGCVRCQGRVLLLRLREITIGHTGCVFLCSFRPLLLQAHLPLFLISLFTPLPLPYLFLPPSQLTLGENKKVSSRSNIRPRSA